MPDGWPVTSITTGNEATPDDPDATSPTEATVPNTGVADPVGVMTAWSPVATFDTSVSSTEELTMKVPVETTTTWDEPLDPELVAAPPCDPPPDPDTCCPTVSETDSTDPV